MPTSLPKKQGYNDDIVVDAGFLTTRQITLQKIPVSETLKVSLNGLLLKNDCYSLSSNILTIDPSLDVQVGDDLLVRYLSQTKVICQGSDKKALQLK